jgi:hypothetical protein
MAGPDADGLDAGESSEAEGPSPVPSLEVIRRIILGMIQAIGDGADLVGASIREELERFRCDLEHRLIVVLLVSAGVLSISVGIVLLLKELIGNWPVTLLLVGGSHVIAGVWLSRYWRRSGDTM